jgi:protein-tyrosine sulfotransferase
VNLKNTLKPLLHRHPRLNTAYGAVRSGGRTLLRRCPASRGAGEILPPPFFIIGAARSGNTLLRALLLGHSRVSIPPESYVLGGLALEWDRVCYQDWDTLVRFVLDAFDQQHDFETWETDLSPLAARLGGVDESRRSLAMIIDAVYRHYAGEKFPGADMWGDKTPLNTERVFLIDRVFPGARYIHMLRDGRDAVSSAVKAGLYGGSVEAACRQWLLRVQMAREFGRTIPANRFMELRYEDLVSDPRASVEAACNFMDLGFQEEMMAHEGAFQKMGDATAHGHHAKVGEPVTTGSIGKWKERLTGEQADFVERAIGEELARIGYSTRD